MNGPKIFEKLRISVATYDQVVFSHPENGSTMLALERKASLSKKDERPNVRSQPFGGGIRILDSTSLQKIIGEIQFDSERSKQEQDFRILIPPSKWEAVKNYSLQHLENPGDPEIEATPDRELVEEFEETLQVRLEPSQYSTHPIGFTIEATPVITENRRAQGQPTVRIYRIFEVRLIDVELCQTMLASSQRYSDQNFGKLALENLQNGGTGRINTTLVLPLEEVKKSYLMLPPEKRYGHIDMQGHKLDESVLAILNDVEVPQYRRI
jgi:hypothetical protein